ncbi:MAG: molybdopterin cofactor-binding domain-containing protein [Pseudomonadota bacterium]
MLKYLEKTPVAPLAGISLEKLSRRSFLVAGSLFSLAAFASPGAAFEQWETGGTNMPFGLRDDPLLFVSIDEDGTVTIVAHRSEMGQGSRTSLPMIIADEMEADWDRVKIVQAEGDEPKYGNQDTDGSRSLRHHFQVARQIGGAVRQMMRTAAAKRWDVPVDQVTVESHAARGPGGQVLEFGDLAAEAMAEPVPPHEAIPYKDEAAFRYVGKGQVQITDLHDITTGAAVYGADVMVPDMRFAVIARPPVVGGRAESFDATAALATPGVVAVHELPYAGMGAKFAPLGGIAVVAENTYAALLGRDALEITWEAGEHGSYNSESYMAEMIATSATPGQIVREKGDVEGAFAAAETSFARTYTQAHMAHIPMEPPAALAHYADGKLEVWAPVQSPYTARTDVAEAMGLDPADVIVHVTLLGGGFGRKSKADYVTEAALLSRMVDAPVRVQWTREDDVRHSFYHTTSAERIEVAMDQGGAVTAWRHTSVAPSIASTFAPDGGHQAPFESGLGHYDMPFDIANVQCSNGQALAHTRIGWFRAVSAIPRGWAIGSFVGEFAAEKGLSQRQAWRQLIGTPRIFDPTVEGIAGDFWNYGEPLNSKFDIDTGRLLNVLDMAADGIGDGQATPENEGIGLAVHRSFVSYVGCAARVRVVDGEIRVPEMHIAIDCGFAANPERIESQIQGAAVMGMTLALHSGITFEDGAVVQSNFYDYDVVRSTNYPMNVVTHIVPHTLADAPPSGAGEPGIVPVAPAIANGLFAATGERKRDLPIGPFV